MDRNAGIARQLGIVKKLPGTRSTQLNERMEFWKVLSHRINRANRDQGTSVCMSYKKAQETVDFFATVPETNREIWRRICRLAFFSMSGGHEE